MPRLPTLLIAAVLAIGLGGVQLAQSQTEQPPAGAETTPAPKGKKAALTPEEKAARKAERAAKRKAMTPEEKAKLKEERAAKKQAKAAKKAKREECRTQAKQDKLKGKELRQFIQTCTAG